MLPSTGYFKTINCPFFDSGLCERPYCHFRHAKKEDLQASTSQEALAGSEKTTAPSLENQDVILHKLVSEAVRKVLLEKEIFLTNEASQNKEDGPSAIVSKVVKKIAAPPEKSQVYSPSTEVPSYKPTPIAQLKKLRNSGKAAEKRKASLEYKPTKKPKDEKSQLAVKYSPSYPNSEAVAGYSPSYTGTESAYTPSSSNQDDSVSYTPSSITMLAPKNSQYVPSNKDGSVPKLPGYQPSDRNQEKEEQSYVPQGNCPREQVTDYKPTAKVLTNDIDSLYLPDSLSVKSSGKNDPADLYIPTDKSKLENTGVLTIENDILEKENNSDADNNDFDLLEEVLSESSTIAPKYGGFVSEQKKPNKTTVPSSKSDERAGNNFLKPSAIVPEKLQVKDKKSVTSSVQEGNVKSAENNVKSDLSYGGRSVSELQGYFAPKSEEENVSCQRVDVSDKQYGANHDEPKVPSLGAAEVSLRSKRKDKSEQILSDKIKPDKEDKSKEKNRSSKSDAKESKADKSNNSSRKTETIGGDKHKSSKSHEDKKSHASKSDSSHKVRESKSKDHRSSKSRERRSEEKEKKIKHHGSSKSGSRHHGSGDKDNRYKHKKQSREKERKEEISRFQPSETGLEKKPCSSGKRGQPVAITKNDALVQYENVVKAGDSETESEIPDLSELDALDELEDEFPLGDDSEPDLDEVTRECYKIFQEYQPEENTKTDASLKKAQQLHETSEAEDSLQNIGKQRVAHTSSHGFVPKSSAAMKAIPKPSASQVMVDRWKKSQETFKQSEEAVVQFAESSKPLGSSLLRSGANARQGKKRIAHVPNVSSLLMAKTQVASVADGKSEGNTVVQSIPKGSKRIAHIPSQEVLVRPTIATEFGSKVPANVRQRYLNLFIDECLKICSTTKDAYERALEEEQNCYGRCTTRTVYLNVAVNSINRLRKEVEGFSATTVKHTADAAGSSGIVANRTVSHLSILAGKGGSKNSWSIERTKKYSDHFSDFEMYHLLEKYLLNTEQLESNGFPRPDPEEKGRARILNVDLKKIAVNPFKRTCQRCSSLYTVNKRGVPVKEEQCIHHWGRQYKRRGMGGWENKYSCCQGDSQTGGCCVAKCHVSDNFDPDNQRGYVKTLPKVCPDGNYGVFALDCEMCYTTMGNELTRVTVIGTDLKPTYETLVKPENPIIDYNTRFSGITEEDLIGVRTTLRDVQAVLLNRFSDKTILIGHSLESDFRALKIIHDTVVDTSVVFPHKMGPPFKRALRTLCADFIKKIIQSDVNGHDSAEDARACMELMIWKIKEDLKGR